MGLLQGLQAQFLGVSAYYKAGAQPTTLFASINLQTVTNQGKINKS